jgi:hypothetical protein
MPRPSSFLRITLLACQTLLCVIAGHAAEPADQWNPKILYKLHEPISFDVSEAPLIDVVEFLAGLHRVSIGLDEDALKAAKIARTVPLTFKSPRVNNKPSSLPLHRALSEMLGEANLSFMIKNQQLLITTAKVAEEWQREFAKYLGSQRR